MDLIDRKYRILQAIIDDYIMTALPVGSRTISRKYEQKLSSATIRNEMSDLEELGYLDSPHTSAGRIPSYKAYRLYVDQMLSHLQLVPISDRRLLLVLVTKSGAVRQSVLDLDKPIAPDALYTVSQIISRELEGCAMDQLPAMLTRLAGGQEGEMRELLGLLAAQPPEKDGGVGSLVVGGRSNLLSFPEYADVDRAKELLSVLETREKVVSLLSHQGEMEISVRIGPETGMEETKDCSIVTASYRLNDGTVNTIGLIGPTRMQYGKVLSVLGEVGRSITELLDGQNENHEKQEEQEK